MSAFLMFLKLTSKVWKVAKPFISTTKETLNVIDTATTLIQKRTSPLIKYVLIVAGAGFSMEQIDALTHIITYFQWTLKTQILAVVFALCLLKMFSDVLLSPLDNLKIALKQLSKMFVIAFQFCFTIILFSFSKKVRKSMFLKISKWWEYSVKTKELEACKQEAKVKSIDEKIKNTEKRIKSFKQK